MTKVPRSLRKPGTVAAVCAALICLPSLRAQAPPAAQPFSSVSAAGRPGPAESLYLQLSKVELDPARVFRVRGASLDRAAIHISLEDGTIAFTKDVMGRITGAFFEGDGEVLLAPPNDVERKSMSLFAGMAILEERFSTAYFRFNDNTPSELQPGLRAPDQPAAFVQRWNETARNLAPADAMRLLVSFSGMLPATGEASSTPATGAETEGRLLHVRLQGNKLGVFDLFFDSTAGEQIEAGHATTAENGTLYYDVWTSFSPAEPQLHGGSEKEISPSLPAEGSSRGDPIFAHSYVIDARVSPPKELEAEVKMVLEVRRGGSRCLVFELSRYLHIQSVEADGRPVEFIQNPAVEGTQLARRGNDLVAVVLPEPAHEGKKILLRFAYRGEVLEEAGKGLLYVGARGTWYPNRGMTPADFDLTFHYPTGWTLLATGNPAPSLPLQQTAQPVRAQSGASDEQISHWVTERPIPVAGFNLGKYARSSAHAGNVAVDTYATAVVEKDFPQASTTAPEVDPTPSLHQMPPPPLHLSAPSPSRNATAVAETAARAIRYFSERFGPYPYSQLALTQLPGPESQGWPGLVFLSSYAFLTPQEEEELHINPAGKLIDQLIPAHETAHQWWGDLVNWSTYRDQWFSEGLANYCSLMILQEENPAGFRLLMEKYRADLAEKNKDGVELKDAGPVTLGGRLLSSRFPEGYEAISYGRGTWLFHMLRSMLQDAADVSRPRDPAHRVADDPFVRGLRKLRERYEGKSITTRKLLDVFAEDLPPSLRYEGRASLDWFLDGWVNGTSLPKLQLHDVKLTPKANTIAATGMIRQKDAPPELVTSVPIYAEVAGKTPVLLGRIFADGPESSFRLQAPAGTRKLLLDPNRTILTSPK